MVINNYENWIKFNIIIPIISKVQTDQSINKNEILIFRRDGTIYYIDLVNKLSISN